MSVRAYTDESMRQRKEDDCVYVLAAVLVDDRHADPVRDALKRLRYRNNPTLHWYDATDKQRTVVASAVAELPLTAIAAVCTYEFRRDERARRQCLRAIARTLVDRGLTDLLISSRSPSQDRLDERLLVGLRSELAPQRLRVSWPRYRDEPLSWAADVVASAITWSFHGQNEFADKFAELLEYIDADDQ